MKTGRKTVSALWLLVGIVTLMSGAAQAQIIPIPIYDDKEKRTISVVVTPGLERTTRLRGQELRDARRAMNAGEQISEELMRELAINRDSLAAMKLVEILVARGLRENASDIAYFASIAVAAGRVWPLPEMVEAMRHIDPKTEDQERIKKYIAVIYAHAWAGNSLALDAVIEFNGPDALFGEMGGITRRRLEEQARIADNGRIELRLALRMMEQGNLSPSEVEAVRGYLDNVQNSPVLGMRAIGFNLNGLLDEEYGPAEVSSE